jgi:carbonic anhydrase
VRHYSKFAIGIVVLITAALSGVGPQTKVKITSDAALAELKAGNENHAQNRYRRPHQTTARLHELVAGQYPEAAVLSCADSRVPPEIIFDQGLGDLFVVRVAGNVATDAEIASLEYGAEHLHVPLLVVLGHENCGAVAATLQGGEADGHIGTLVELIKPAVEKSRTMTGDPLSNAVRTNVQMVVQQLRTTKPILSKLVAEGKLKIIGGVYSLETGKVTWLSD